MLEGWKSVALSELATFHSGGTPNKERSSFWGGPIPWVTVKDMKAMRLNGVGESLTEEGANTVRVVPARTVLVLVRGMGLFKDLPVVLCDGPVTFNQDIKALVAKEGVDSEYLAFALIARKSDILRHVDSAGHGTGRLDTDLLKSTPLPLPPLPEQRKIAEILRTWDEAIEKLEALRAAKQNRFTGLKQQIMGRGGAFPERWPLKALSAVSTPVRRKSAGNNHPVMTISAKSGFLMQSDKFARDMAGRSVERYTLLHEGEFAYNKGNSKTAPYGCVFRLDRPTALVPFVYYCFALKPGLDPEFYEHLFAAGALNHQLSRLINSGVRNDGLLNLYSDDFYSCRVPVPPIDEQRKIARAMTAAKQELALLDEDIEALTRQKRGLMQKLLTGEWRVKLEVSVA
ncbi:type I restriction-modification protein subunit S [Iodidimonas gelatinilytica]|uniref:Type I restriction-modification protein subunit S n=1 Tax=Iodidimonas gelatinilytica TaxID=1236966 RepID=A0A5A7MTN3_9PROT|nr:restriction endonuclease subunit S [Iodidimonas gelatinilytica]GEQ99331.1 type I restriction-modification protein subunit S [Iodidimonas gelatinilytica]